MIRFAHDSEIVLLQDFKMFAWMASTPLGFHEIDLEVKVSTLSGVAGLKSEAIGTGMSAIIVWMLG